MSHALTTTNGKVEMGFLAGTDRWHGLGNELRDGASIDEWITASGMEWKVKRSKVRYVTPANEGEPNDFNLATREWPEQHVLFRSDTKAALGLVSEKFKVVQPRDCIEFFRDLCDTNGFKMRTAGTLHGGRKFWALADIGAESYVLDPQDKVKGRLLIVSACDGTSKTIAKFVAECVVCQNTLTIAMGEASKQIAVSHRSVFNADDTKMKLGLASGQFTKMIHDMRELASTAITQDEARYFTTKLLAGPDVANKFAGINSTATFDQVKEVQATRGYKQIMGLFDGKAIAANLDGRKGTAWAWLNAVTEYADHHVTARSDDNRFDSSQFGVGDKMKSEAFDMLGYIAA